MPKHVAKKESPLTLSQLVKFFADHVEPRFSSLEEEIKGIRIDIAEIRAQQEDLYKKYEDLHIEYTVIKEQLSRIEAKLDLEIHERKILGEELPRLKHQVVQLQNRIEELERRPGSP